MVTKVKQEVGFEVFGFIEDKKTHKKVLEEMIDKAGRIFKEAINKSGKVVECKEVIANSDEKKIHKLPGNSNYYIRLTHTNKMPKGYVPSMEVTDLKTEKKYRPSKIDTINKKPGDKIKVELKIIEMESFKKVLYKKAINIEFI